MQKCGLTKKELLRLKIELLCEGANLSADLDRGRKAGGGPVGGRYVLLPGGFKVNTALWGRFPSRSSWEMQENCGNFFLVKKNANHKDNIPIKIIPQPSFYSEKTSDGTPMWKIAILHGTDCLATTVYQKCNYITANKGCKFYPRCDFAMKICEEQKNPSFFAKPEHMVKCWLFNKK